MTPRQRAQKFFDEAPPRYAWEFNHCAKDSQFVDDLEALIKEVEAKAFVRGHSQG